MIFSICNIDLANKTHIDVLQIQMQIMSEKQL